MKHDIITHCWILVIWETMSIFVRLFSQHLYWTRSSTEKPIHPKRKKTLTGKPLQSPHDDLDRSQALFRIYSQHHPSPAIRVTVLSGSIVKAPTIIQHCLRSPRTRPPRLLGRLRRFSPGNFLITIDSMASLRQESSRHQRETLACSSGAVFIPPRSGTTRILKF